MLTDWFFPSLPPSSLALFLYSSSLPVGMEPRASCILSQQFMGNCTPSSPDSSTLTVGTAGAGGGGQRLL